MMARTIIKSTVFQKELVSLVEKHLKIEPGTHIWEELNIYCDSTDESRVEFRTTTSGVKK